MVGYVEMQTAAECAVQYLYSAADAESWDISFVGKPCQLELIFVALRKGIGKPRRIVLAYTAKPRDNIAAPREKYAVTDADRGVRRAYRRKYYRYAACFKYSFTVLMSEKIVAV